MQGRTNQQSTTDFKNIGSDTPVYDFQKEFYINDLTRFLRRYADSGYVFLLNFNVQMQFKTAPVCQQVTGSGRRRIRALKCNNLVF